MERVISVINIPFLTDPLEIFMGAKVCKQRVIRVMHNGSLIKSRNSAIKAPCWDDNKPLPECNVSRLTRAILIAIWHSPNFRGALQVSFSVYFNTASFHSLTLSSSVLIEPLYCFQNFPYLDGLSHSKDCSHYSRWFIELHTAVTV